MLDVSKLSVMYGAHRALENASIHVDTGEVVVILGANGAGKSSLLKAISGTCEGETVGTVKLEDQVLTGMPAEEIVTRGVAFVPEGRGIFGDLSVGENLLLGAHSRHARVHQNRNLARVYELFPKLKERDKQIARTMSGGEQQMVAIGRAMMADPKILMLDEPSLGLSPLLCKELFQNLSHIRDSGIGVLMVEQNAKQSLAISNRAYLLENGTITGEGEASALMDDPSVQAAYLGGAHNSTEPKTTHIVVDDGLPVSSDSASGADQTPDQIFVQPSGIGRSSGSSGQIAGVDIGALVERASHRSEPDFSAAPVAPRSKPDIRDHSKTHFVPVPLSSGPDNADVQNLLTQFETAANAAARSGNGSTGASPSQSVFQEEEREHLPTIPIYRKSKLEVYRRTPAGDLVKVKEV